MIAQHFALGVVIHTTNDSQCIQASVLTQGIGVFTDLQRQFARWSNNQGAGFTGKTFFRLNCQKAVKNRQQKRCCFTCARLGLPDHVATSQSGRQTLGLNR